MAAITLYISQEISELLESERARRKISSKPKTINFIIEDYFRRKGLLEEEEEEDLS